jgi:hypothetical protein
MKLAECRARELAYRDAVARGTGVWGACPQWDTVCPRSGLVAGLPRRPQTMANTPELEGATT